MAGTTKASSSVPHNHNNKNKYRYIFTTLVFLFLFLFSILLFTKRSLEPPISLYRDFFSQNQNQNQNENQTQISSSFSSQETPIYEPISRISPETINEEVSEKNEEHPLPKNGVSVEPISPISPKIINEEIADKNEEYPLSENVVSVGNERLKECDLYNGSWVKDEENQYPIYKPGSCPYVDEAFDCQSNGRTDHHYLKWRWKPHSCDLPRFNATDFLARIRGKKLMLVGDSMNRNQFESILCLLREGLHNKSKMYEVHGHKITKGRGYYVFKFEDYNCTVDFVRSHFLVREGVRVNGQGNSNPTLSIDRIDKTSARWKRADILVFNTGHWWTHGKTARGKNYYREGDYVYPQFDSVEAYRRSLKTWANWIYKNVNPQKQLVFYRGYSSAHFRGGDWDSGGSCNGETEPAFTGAILDNYPLKMKIVEETIRDMRVPLKLLNVTRLTNFRKDGHPSIYGKNLTAGKKVSKRRQDCSHWCLPGVPDAWNELIYATLVLDQTNTVEHSLGPIKKLPIGFESSRRFE